MNADIPTHPRTIFDSAPVLLIEPMESDKPNFVKQHLVDRAIAEAAFVLERIDLRWPQ